MRSLSPFERVLGPADRDTSIQIRHFERDYLF
jgi:hypothetical protein